jgi:hypothetical protein
VTCSPTIHKQRMVAFPFQQCLRQRATMLRCAYIVCLFVRTYSYVCSALSFLSVMFWIWKWQNQIMNRLYVSRGHKGCCQNSNGSEVEGCVESSLSGFHFSLTLTLLYVRWLAVYWTMPSLLCSPELESLSHDHTRTDELRREAVAGYRYLSLRMSSCRIVSR